MSNEWLSQLISVLEEALKDDGKISFTSPTGKEVLAEVSDEVVDLLRNNRQRLLQVGKDAVVRYLELMSEGKSFDALVEMYSALDNVEIVDRVGASAQEMMETALEIQAARRFWLELGRKLGTRLAIGLLGLLII